MSYSSIDSKVALTKEHQAQNNSVKPWLRSSTTRQRATQHDLNRLSFDSFNSISTSESNLPFREKLRRNCSRDSFCRIAVVITLILGLISFFLVWPISDQIEKYGRAEKFYEDRFTNYTKVHVERPPKPNLPLKPDIFPIDPDTPDSAYEFESSSGEMFQLVFSDEFDEDGRTFFPGDDPHWEAEDLWYRATEDLEWYKPEQVTTKDGYLQITMEERQVGDLNVTSGLLTSWNKFCFQGGILQVNVSYPGEPDVPGLWPAVWLLGNLSRAGYTATTDGLWPYTYDSCDIGVLQNQTNNALSALPGQRLNKCVCAGEDHPSPGKGRSSPELDLIEARFGPDGPTVQQSIQLAPFDYRYRINEDHISLAEGTQLNTFVGGPVQQVIASESSIDEDIFQGKRFETFTMEYEPGPNGYLVFHIGDEEKFRLNAAAIGPNPFSHISQRPIPEEPMYIILNLAMSLTWSIPDFDQLKLPAIFYIDYVRVYQHPEKIAISCDPPDYPTWDYIWDHIQPYTNPNITKWSYAGFGFPKFDLDGNC